MLALQASTSVIGGFCNTIYCINFNIILCADIAEFWPRTYLSTRALDKVAFI